jgi:hypothetical protein
MMDSNSLPMRTMMPEVDTDQYTVGVFQDVSGAEKGVEALKRQGLPPESLTILGTESPELAAMIERAVGSPPEKLLIRGLGGALARGPLVGALQGRDDGLAHLGIGGTMTRVGFQPHDGRIYDALTARGGVLVAIHSEPRAADALAVLFSYGGGNAAIGAWTGRV